MLYRNSAVGWGDKDGKNTVVWASPLIQQLRICLAMQGTPIPSLILEDHTCCRVTKPLRHDHETCAHQLQPLSPSAATTEAWVPQSPCSATRETAARRNPSTTAREWPPLSARQAECSNNNPAQPWMNKSKKKKREREKKLRTNWKTQN